MDPTEHEKKLELLNAELAATRLWMDTIEAAGDGFWDWNLISGDMTYSRRWKEKLGFSEEEIGRTKDEWFARIHPDDQRKVYAVVNTMMDGAQDVFSSEYRLQCKDGSWIWLLTRGKATRDAGGMLVRLSGINTDVTERRQRETLLQDELAYTRRINDTLDYVQAYIYIKTKDRKYVYGNSAFLELFNIKGRELPGCDDSRFFPPETVARLGEVDRRVLEQGEITQEEMEASPGAAGWRAYFEIKNPIYDENGDIWGLCGVFTDITERKKVEAEIRRLNDELETHVQERTSQLELAQQELAALAASMAHSLKTPLRALDGFSYLLLDEYSAGLDAQGQDYLNRIRSASRRIWQVTDDLLNLLSIARSDLSLARVNLSSVARDIIGRLKADQPERQIEFICPDSLVVEADTTMAQIMMENLLNNAWKFTRSRHQTRIELGSLVREGNPVYFVRDNGVGIDMAYIEKLFGVFQRLHSPDEFEGSGIGLAITQRIIQRHGGRIWAEGVVDQGATFYFSFR